MFDKFSASHTNLGSEPVADDLLELYLQVVRRHEFTEADAAILAEIEQRGNFTQEESRLVSRIHYALKRGWLKKKNPEYLYCHLAS